MYQFLFCCRVYANLKTEAMFWPCLLSQQRFLWQEHQAYHLPVGDSSPSSNVVCVVTGRRSSSRVSACDLDYTHMQLLCKHMCTVDNHLHTSSALQVQQLCTVGISFLQALLLPIDSSQRSFSKMRTKWPSHVVQFSMHVHFPWSKKMANLL